MRIPELSLSTLLFAAVVVRLRSPLRDRRVAHRGTVVAMASRGAAGTRTWWTPSDGSITVAVRVTTGGHRSELIEIGPDRLRVRVAARAVEGMANVELVRYLAELFDVRRSAVSLVRGARSRDKTVRVVGVPAPPAELLRPGSTTPSP